MFLLGLIIYAACIVGLLVALVNLLCLAARWPE